METKTQNGIRRTLSKPEAVTHIRSILKTNDCLTRTELASLLCEQFSFCNARGEKQMGSCLKVLRDLASQGRFTLPEPKVQRTGKWCPRRLDGPVAEPTGLPSEVNEIADLRLVLVEDEAHMRIWNELMLREHPLGDRRLMGRQLRYLVHSEHGWLGALGFGPAALHLSARDEWIGWDWPLRQDYLEQVVGLSRFLIRPSVHCRNLASRTLGMCMRHFPEDFSARYGYEPWLVETFVDPSQFLGTCFRAANWQLVGQTQGRGRQDRERRRAETVKDIYVYCLAKDLRQRMGLPMDAGKVPLSVAAGLDGDQWAKNEFGGSSLGDQRLTNRVISVAKTKAEQPGYSWTYAAGGDNAATQGYYRLIDHADEAAVNMPNILKPHRERTVRRMQAQTRVLAIQDTTDLNYSSLAQCQGLGIIGNNQTKTKTKGLRLHTTFVVTPEGLPLGILRADCYARELKPQHKGKDRRYIPIEEKETLRWLEGVQDCMVVSHQLPNVQVICVMDSEADIFELFDEQRRDPSVQLLIRAMHHNRRTTGPLNLLDTVLSTKVKHRAQISIQRRSARPKKGRRAALPARPARSADVAIRYCRVQIRPPEWGVNSHKQPIEVSAIHVLEEHPPEGQERLEWLLLTTLGIDLPEDAMFGVRAYAKRWRIEDWHRVLKSGCEVEDARHETAERLKRFIAINMVVAWRIMLMTLLGREAPDLPPEVLFTDLELTVLSQYASKKNFRCQQPSSVP